jgi:hypothetical protein
MLHNQHLACCTINIWPAAQPTFGLDMLHNQCLALAVCTTNIWLRLAAQPTSGLGVLPRVSVQMDQVNEKKIFSPVIK